MNDLRNLEMRVARLEKQSASKTEAYEALRSFMAQNKTNTRLLIELGGYLQVLKDGGDLSDRDLKNIRKMMHRNNASDLADSFRSNPTGRVPKVPARKTRTRIEPIVEESPYPTVQEVFDFLERSRTRTGGGMEGWTEIRKDSYGWSMTFNPDWRMRLDHYGNDGEGWDQDGWDEEYVQPLTYEIQKLLVRKWSIFKEVERENPYFVDIGEKGHIHITLDPTKFKRDNRRASIVASKEPELEMRSEVMVVEDINEVYGEDFDTDMNVYVEDYGVDSKGNIIFLCELQDVDYYAIVIESKRTKDQSLNSVYSRKSDAKRDFKSILRD